MAGGGAHDKTEKATPKKREDARKKGQVAKSADLNGASVVGAIVAAALVPTLPSMGSMVGMTPAQLGGELVSTIMGIAQRAAIAYLAIGLADVAWQRHRHEKQLRMD